MDTKLIIWWIGIAEPICVAESNKLKLRFSVLAADPEASVSELGPKSLKDTKSHEILAHVCIKAHLKIREEPPQ